MIKYGQKKLFLSSTCYDLLKVREIIEKWAIEHDFFPLLSNKPDFPVDLDIHRHDSCLANAKAADIMVLVIARRFGAPYYLDKTISITWAEFRAALESGVRIITFIDKRTWDHRATYHRTGNCEDKDIDVRVFDFIDEVQAHANGLWIELYDKDGDIPLRLSNLASLFSVPQPMTPTYNIEVSGKRIVTKTLSIEAQHHVYLVLGNFDLLDEEHLLRCIIAIPEGTTTQFMPDMSQHGFSVLMEQVPDSQQCIVRPTPLGLAIREQLEFALCLLP